MLGPAARNGKENKPITIATSTRTYSYVAENGRINIRTLERLGNPPRAVSVLQLHPATTGSKRYRCMARPKAVYSIAHINPRGLF